MSKNDFFKVYTSDATVSRDFPFHISRNLVSGEKQDLVQLVSALHSHEFMQILYVADGRVTNEILGHSDEISAGELITVPPLVKHRNDYFEGAELYTISFMPSFVDSALDSHFLMEENEGIGQLYFLPFLDMARDEMVMRKFRFSSQEGQQVDLLFRQLVSDFAKANPENRLRLHCNFLRLLSLLALHYMKRRELPPEARGQAPGYEDHFRRMYAVINRMKEDYAQDLRVEQVIQESGLSASYFRRFFKEITGKGFVAYLNELRVYNAILIMKAQPGQLSLKELAWALGYKDFQSFHRAFQKIVGSSPSAFRRDELG